MIIKAKNISNLKKIIEKIKFKIFSVETQYKFLKIRKIVESEQEIINEQKEILIKKYAEFDDQGRPVIQGGRVVIKKEYVNECALQLQQLNALEISMPDLYFSIEELENLGLTFEELSYLEPFIKN